MKENTSNARIAYFISPHGYGHAARAAAVMEAICRIEPAMVFDIFTKVPEWFFRDSLSQKFHYHSTLTDIGLVQTSPLRADLQKTVEHLDHLMPFDPLLLKELTGFLKEKGCRMVICDIAPMGIAAALEAGVPSILIENFTWDWIYEPYALDNNGLARHITYLKEFFHKANYHIQTKPVCEPGIPDLTTKPVSRKPRLSPQKVCEKLGLGKEEKLVMITMGGIPESYGFLEKLKGQNRIRFIIPGISREIRVEANLILLPHHSPFFHPDLVNAADAVIGKAGYSTLAEVYNGGVPFGYVARENFRESDVLVSYIESEMCGIRISENDFHEANWVSDLSRLIDLARIDRGAQQGADQVALFILDLLAADFRG